MIIKDSAVIRDFLLNFDILKYAAIEDVIQGMEGVSEDVKQFIINIENKTIQGSLFGILRKNPAVSLQELEQNKLALEEKESKKEKAKAKGDMGLYTEREVSSVQRASSDEELKKYLLGQLKNFRLIKQEDVTDLVANNIDNILKAFEAVKSGSFVVRGRKYDKGDFFRLDIKQLIELTDVWLESDVYTAAEMEIAEGVDNYDLRKYLLNQMVESREDGKDVSQKVKENLDDIKHAFAEVLNNTFIIEDRKYNKESFLEFNLDEILNIIKVWKSGSGVKITEYKENQVAYEVKNPDYLGFKIIEITNPEDLMLEGKLLGHCTKNGGYNEKLKTKESRFFSLRNFSNAPQVTIESSENLYLFKQQFGFRNAQPTADQMIMLNEWKRSLHPKDKIVELAKSKNTKDRINASSFMDFSDPDYEKIIIHLVKTERDSRKSNVGSAVSNKSLDVLQALAQNETLPDVLYDVIYNKCQSNETTVFNLARNKSVSEELLIKIYDSGTSIVCTAVCSNINIKNYKTLVEKIKQKGEQVELIKLANNLSFSSSDNIKLISDKFDIFVEFIRKPFGEDDLLKNLEGKFLEDFIFVIENKVASNKVYVDSLADVFNALFEKCDNLRQNDLQKILKMQGVDNVKDLNAKELILRSVQVFSKKEPSILFDFTNHKDIELYIQSTNADPETFSKLYNGLTDEGNKSYALSAYVQSSNADLEKFFNLYNGLEDEGNKSNALAGYAKNPNADPKIFSKLYNGLEDEGNKLYVLAAYAINPNANPETFFNLYNGLTDTGYKLRTLKEYLEEYAKNPNADPETFSKLYNGLTDEGYKSNALSAYVQSSNADLEKFFNLYNGLGGEYYKSNALAGYAKNPNADPKIFSKLYNGLEDERNKPYVLKEYAKNPNADPETFSKLYNGLKNEGNKLYVLAAYAINPNANPETFFNLYNGLTDEKYKSNALKEYLEAYLKSPNANVKTLINILKKSKTKQESIEISKAIAKLNLLKEATKSKAKEAYNKVQQMVRLANSFSKKIRLAKIARSVRRFAGSGACPWHLL